jgi:TPR repeat protein
MNDAPLTACGASSRARPRFLVLFQTICILAVSVRAGYASPVPQSRPSVQEQNTGPEQQFKMVQLKAAQGDAEAQFKLGLMYADDDGVAHDFVEALKWTNLAASRVPGDTEKVFADRLAAKMSAVQVAEAQKRAQEWTLAFEKRKK